MTEREEPGGAGHREMVFLHVANLRFPSADGEGRQSRRLASGCHPPQDPCGPCGSASSWDPARAAHRILNRANQAQDLRFLGFRRSSTTGKGPTSHAR